MAAENEGGPKFKKGDWIRYAPNADGIVAYGHILAVKELDYIPNAPMGGYYLVDWIIVQSSRDTRPPNSYFPIFGLDKRATLCEAAQILYGKKDKV